MVSVLSAPSIMRHLLAVPRAQSVDRAMLHRRAALVARFVLQALLRLRAVAHASNAQLANSVPPAPDRASLGVPALLAKV